MQITNPHRDELEETLRMAFRHLPPQELPIRIAAILDLFFDRDDPLSGVFRAEEDGRPVGALYAQKRPDGNVMLWAPTMLDGRSTAPFFEPLERFCLQNGAAAAMALVDRNQAFDEPSLCDIGKFDYLSDLVYLVATISEDDAKLRSELLRFVPLDSHPNSMKRLETLIQITYHDSRDFPRLMSVTPVDKVLEGYRAGGSFLSELWFFVREEGRDIGVLLMTDQSEEQIELTYMGLVSEARARGLSREIVRFARRMASLRKRRYLLTAADEQNIAALSVYLSQGFRAWDRKKVFARLFV